MQESDRSHTLLVRGFEAPGYSNSLFMSQERIKKKKEHCGGEEREEERKDGGYVGKYGIVSTAALGLG